MNFIYSNYLKIWEAYLSSQSSENRIMASEAELEKLFGTVIAQDPL